MDRQYLCIDLKSFYASVECVERGLDPLDTNLVVADNSRTEKTICLAVTPSLKSLGISGRARLFEVVRKVREQNFARRKSAPYHRLTQKSYSMSELSKNPSLELDYIIAPPRMAHYMEYSTKIYKIYLKHVSYEDILVYSIDEVFIDITDYLYAQGCTAREFAIKIIRNVLAETGITATAGIGTNMYLAKIAMDITAKKMPPDENGVRIAELNESGYRSELWEHKPLTDFWRIGKGYCTRLQKNHIYTMGDIARISLTPHGRKLLKKLFGVNASLLIDHAWGYEPCTIKEAKSYVPENSSISSSQVLHYPYDFETARIIVREMTELMSLELVEKNLATNQIVLTVGYDTENLADPMIRDKYKGEIMSDFYGRKVPKHAHGTVNISRVTSSSNLITSSVMDLYDKIVDRLLLVRRINITANKLILEKNVQRDLIYEQTDMFTDYDALDIKRQNENDSLERERKLQKATIEIRNRFGKNSLLKGTNLKEGATTIDRNNQIGGHKA